MAQEKSPVEWLRAKTAESYVPAPATVVAGGSDSKTPAPKKDQVKGSKENKPDSAKSTKSASSIKFSERVETALKNKVEEHNKNAKDGRRATLSMLKAVYRRGAGAFSTSHRPGMSRDQWAMARVNAFLKLLKSGKPSNSAYTTDNDLLPASHPRSSKKSNSAIAAGASEIDEYEAEISVTVPDDNEFSDTGTAILALTEMSGLGYEAEFAIKASWIRGVDAGQNPYKRARELAVRTYESPDADLLPVREEESAVL